MRPDFSRVQVKLARLPLFPCTCFFASFVFFVVVVCVCLSCLVFIIGLYSFDFPSNLGHLDHFFDMLMGSYVFIYHAGYNILILNRINFQLLFGACDLVSGFQKKYIFVVKLKHSDLYHTVVLLSIHKSVKLQYFVLTCHSGP